jgi:hypothetical protein
VLVRVVQTTPLTKKHCSSATADSLQSSHVIICHVTAAGVFPGQSRAPPVPVKLSATLAQAAATQQHMFNVLQWRTTETAGTLQWSLQWSRCHSCNAQALTCTRALYGCQSNGHCHAPVTQDVATYNSNTHKYGRFRPWKC